MTLTHRHTHLRTYILCPSRPQHHEPTNRSPGDKAADWQARVGQPEAEEEGKQEGKDGVLASGVAAPALLQAASTIWSVSSSALLGLFGMGCVVAVDGGGD